jgi:hypothetical protein
VTLGHSVIVEALGWAAIATFVEACRDARSAQIAGALMWVVYGVLVGSAPVIAANVLVVGAGAPKRHRTATIDMTMY